jgi:hypothetical protein
MRDRVLGIVARQPAFDPGIKIGRRRQVAIEIEIGIGAR